ncbi:alpha/beta hydrolase family protein [Halomicrococcus sp. NG-SE-24]|uniref:alpha/beta hydrolase family protein n=1 Tax=Halomicrococcus sp. NG-SE-24 TaxID=3436928 RepID=UPI003D95C947
MSVTNIELEVGDNTYTGRLNVPTEGSKRGIVVRPGAGHGPYGDIFDRFAEEAADRGYRCLRFQTWGEQENLRQKTLSDLHDEVDAAIARLQSEGCAEISIVAKSFGAGMSLTHIPNAVEAMVLWAPAIGVEDTSNVGAVKEKQFSEGDRPVVSPTFLEEIEIPVLILHGTDDETVPVRNSQQMVNALPDGELLTLDREDHSFRGAVESEVVAQTLTYLDG